MTETPTLASNCKQNHATRLFNVTGDQRLDQIDIPLVSPSSDTGDKTWKVHKGEICEIFSTNLQRDIILRK